MFGKKARARAVRRKTLNLAIKCINEIMMNRCDIGSSGVPNFETLAFCVSILSLLKSGDSYSSKDYDDKIEEIYDFLFSKANTSSSDVYRMVESEHSHCRS